MDLSTLPSLSQVINHYQIATRKSLGQHFLLDGSITDTIVRYAGDLTDVNVIEIGPGPGGLTRSLLKAGAKKLFVIEKDERCVAALEDIKKLAGERLEIITGDALEISLLDIPAPRKIVANLPYNAGTMMLLNWLDAVYRNTPPPVGGRLGGGRSLEEPSQESPHPNPPPNGEGTFLSMTLMFQKEVAERFVAAPANKDFGRLSVVAQWLCDCRWDMELPPTAFTPPPKVESTVITLTPRPKPLVDVRKDMLEKVVAKAFGQRRKMLRSSLKGLAVPPDLLLEKAGIDGSLRAEQLDVVTLCNLAKCYQEML